MAMRNYRKEFTELVGKVVVSAATLWAFVLMFVLLT